MEESKIMITLLKSGIATVWNKTDVIRLKQELRIPGTLMGSLPRKPWQNQVMSLPLLLMPEEVSLLLDKGFAYLADKEISMHPDSKNISQDFRTLRDASHFHQMQLFVKERENKQMRFRNESKRKEVKMEDDCSGTFCSKPDNYCNMENRYMKLEKEGATSRSKAPIGQLGNQEMPTKDINDVSVSASDMQYYSKATFVHVPTTVETGSLLSQSVLNDAGNISWEFPSSVEDKSKYAVFCNVWEKGYYITNGAKFGSDYLLYPGDPSSYHSHYIVKIIPSTKYCIPNQILAYMRLASAVKKTFVLAIVNQDDFSVRYQPKSWAPVD